MRIKINPAAFLGGALVLCAVWLWLRAAPPPIETLATQRSSARPARVERASITLDPAVLERYVGRYEGRANFTAEISLDKGRLFVQSPGVLAPFELRATSETQFFLRAPNGTDAGVDVKFQIGRGGVVEGFVADTEYGPLEVDRVR
jgi:hypothetical protein